MTERAEDVRALGKAAMASLSKTPPPSRSSAPAMTTWTSLSLTSSSTMALGLHDCFSDVGPASPAPPPPYAPLHRHGISSSVESFRSRGPSSSASPRS